MSNVCDIRPLRSCMCLLGTKSCIKSHSAAELGLECSRLRAEVASLKEENENLKAYAMHERSLGAEPWMLQCNALTQQLAAADRRVERIINAARPVLRNALDRVDVHPCDYNSDAARANQCSEEVQALYAALSDLPEADKEKSE